MCRRTCVRAKLKTFKSQAMARALYRTRPRRHRAWIASIRVASRSKLAASIAGMIDDMMFRSLVGY